MANRRFTSQFNYSFERMPVSIMSSFAQTDAGAFASLTHGQNVFQARIMGSAGNSIRVALLNPGGTGGISVSVVGRDISVTLARSSGTITSDSGDVAVAIQNNVAANALITVQVLSIALQTAMAITNLSGGDDTDYDSPGVAMELTQIGTGLYQIELQDSYSNLLSCQLELQRESGPADRVLQIVSEDVVSSKLIVIRAVAMSTQTEENLSNGDVIYIRLDLRNSANPLTNS